MLILLPWISFLVIGLSGGEWVAVKQSLMRFFQGKRIKVSLFLQQSLQTVDGALVLKHQGMSFFNNLTYRTKTSLIDCTINCFGFAPHCSKLKENYHSVRNCLAQWDSSKTMKYTLRENSTPQCVWVARQPLMFWTPHCGLVWTCTAKIFPLPPRHLWRPCQPRPSQARWVRQLHWKPSPQLTNQVRD